MTLPYLFSSVLLSPLPFALLIAWGVLRLQRQYRGGLAMITGSLIALLVCCTPAFGNLMLNLLEPPQLDDDPVPQALARTGGLTPVTITAQAIVILSANRNRNAPEWGGETVDAHTAARTRYGAALARRTGLPVLVSGGSPGLGSSGAPMQPLAMLMAQMLSNEFGVVPRWIEQESLTTAQNASLSAPLLQSAGIQRVILVTSAVHMPRALRTFRMAGFDPVAAPTDYMGAKTFSWRDLLPTVEGLRRSHVAGREALANLWYWLGRGS